VPDSEVEDVCEEDIIECWDQAQAGWSLEGAAAAQGFGCAAAHGCPPAGAGGGLHAAAGVQAAAGAKEYDYETVFTNAKAGMDDVDKAYVKRVVHEMSKDSNFFKNEQRKGEENSRRIEELKRKLDALSPAELDAADKWAAKFMQEQARYEICDRSEWSGVCPAEYWTRPLGGKSP